MSKPDGGLAFPSLREIDMHTGPSREEVGMTLRDYFAGQALAGIMANNSLLVAANQDDNVKTIVAEMAYETADAMLAERER